jgi:hypothetical protein
VPGGRADVAVRPIQQGQQIRLDDASRARRIDLCGGPGGQDVFLTLPLEEALDKLQRECPCCIVVDCSSVRACAAGAC